jgi:hypothetical protein
MILRLKDGSKLDVAVGYLDLVSFYGLEDMRMDFMTMMHLYDLFNYTYSAYSIPNRSSTIRSTIEAMAYLRLDLPIPVP